MHVLRQAHAYDAETHTFRFMRFNPEYNFSMNAETVRARFPIADIILGCVAVWLPYANVSFIASCALSIPTGATTRK